MISIRRRVQFVAILSGVVAIALIGIVTARSTRRIEADARARSMQLVAGHVSRELDAVESEVRLAVTAAKRAELEGQLFALRRPGPDALEIQGRLADRYRRVFYAEEAVQTVHLLSRDRSRVTTLRSSTNQFSFPSPLDPGFRAVLLELEESGAALRRTNDTVYALLSPPSAGGNGSVVVGFDLLSLRSRLLPALPSWERLALETSDGALLFSAGGPVDDGSEAVLPGSWGALRYEEHHSPLSFIHVLLWPSLIGALLYFRVRERYVLDLTNLAEQVARLPAASRRASSKIVPDSSSMPIAIRFIRVLAIFPLTPVGVALIVALVVTGFHAAEVTRESIATQRRIASASVQLLEQGIESATAQVLFSPALQEGMRQGQAETIERAVFGVLSGSANGRIWDDLRTWRVEVTQTGESAVSGGGIGEVGEGCDTTPAPSGALTFGCVRDSLVVYQRVVRSTSPGSFGAPLGTASFGFAETAFIELFVAARPTRNGYFLLVTPGGEIVGGEQGEIGQSRGSLRYHPIRNSFLELASFVPYGDVALLLWDTMRAILTAVVAIALLTVLLTGWAALLLSRPVVELAGKLTNAGKGERLNPTESQVSEVSLVAEAFNGLIDRVESLLEENYQSRIRMVEEEALLREARLAGLQKQINPHFIFNTLESLRQYALEREQGELASLVATIGRLFRYAARTEAPESSLAQEITIASDYLRLQEFRYETAFSGSWTVPAEAESIRCLRFLIQPLVENSFAHAYRGEQENFRVDVSIEVDTKVVVTVADNGVPTDEIPHIPSLVAEGSGHEGLGLSNIRRRLELRYGPEATLQFARPDPETGVGARTLVVFPRS